ncbi:CGNR zinc finger domain-containing protein [Virgisporangium ochraceum]|uniref:Zinc finger CGNR domain-containing protein n=1 Tax=Virgisporangium ochraceum TaxID=65505 RepID=A0A8J4A5W9_9ACTN|nr:CGNR zinc finger domain-containing protein [Virgisporangium ochraceum]GIJ73401.1 hypothetical protein Voc01_083180 [Virgisporangium ochraceum]
MESVTRTVPATAPGDLALVQRFLNTLHVERGTDELADPGAAATWLAAARLPGEPDLALLRGLRRELRALCGDGTPHPGRLAAIADAAPLQVALDPHDHLVLRPHGAGAAVATLLAHVVDAQADGTWHRLKICRHDGCRWAFYDGSRSRTATWCAMGICGNRTKVAAYRRRSPAG